MMPSILIFPRPYSQTWTRDFYKQAINQCTVLTSYEQLMNTIRNAKDINTTIPISQVVGVHGRIAAPPKCLVLKFCLTQSTSM